MCSLNDAARMALEALMRSGTYEYQSEFARRYLAQGREEGLKEGLKEGEMSALLEVLEARGLQVDEQSRQRIVACTELEQLKRWLRKSVSVQSVRELFESAST